MPELPEVETVMRGMERAILHQTIRHAQRFRDNIRFIIPNDMEMHLKNARIDSFSRIGKYILMHLNNGHGWLLHLGMSGRIRIDEIDEKAQDRQKHDHYMFETFEGAHITYNDPRRFGILDMLRLENIATHPLLKHMGPDPFSNQFNAAYLYEALKNKNTNLKQALMDQRLVAGLGNIYVCEALYQARLSPLKQASKIKAAQADALYQAIIEILRCAIEAGGSTLRDYAHTDGNLGYFQHQFKVYDRAGQPCPDCDCDIGKTNGIQRIVQSGRSSFYCPRKQA